MNKIKYRKIRLKISNKVFKEFVLDNSQKMKVVENFDRAQTVREIKLVYTTLCENLSTSKKRKNITKINESASSKSGSTKPKRKIISEEKQVANRFKKLAGLIK